MSKIGVMADIHGNLPALQRALDILQNAPVDAVSVCGDVVGYGTSPNECCDRIRALNCPVVAGNHDWAVADLTEYKNSHSIRAIKGINYTKKVISEENLDWLKSLPLHIKENGMEFVHASLFEGEKWYYLSAYRYVTSPGKQDVRASFAKLKGQVCFVGHSHYPRMFLEKQQDDIQVITPHSKSYELRGCRAIVDAGSVGRPRDSANQSSLVIYDTDNQKIDFKYFALLDDTYPIPQTGKKQISIRKSVKQMIRSWFARN